MGLLDDAIREHLDLKRRRGADPAEVERAEREALGPVRRKGDPSVATAPEDDAAASEAAYDEAPEAGLAPADEEPRAPAGAYDHELDAPDADATVNDRDEDEGWSYEEERTRVVPPRGEPAASVDFADSDDEPFADDEPETPDRERHAGPPPAGDETTEYDVEEAMAAEEGDEAEAEDMLEETPDFLQDTPDHDRLWFEQRPPRDFDFDG